MAEIPFITNGDFGQGEIAHGFFGRRGGVSAGIYESLNCGLGSGDDPEKVRENRGRVAQALGVTARGLITAHQIHSDLCTIVTEPWSEEQRPKVDAMATDVPGIALGILTADCAPVLFSAVDRDRRPLIAAAHAGWGGALRGILETTQAALHTMGAVSIRACIGPCIRQDSYEVRKISATLSCATIR
jgi:copper oxidase (laccase) domain-containing protein